MCIRDRKYTRNEDSSHILSCFSLNKSFNFIFYVENFTLVSEGYGVRAPITENFGDLRTLITGLAQFTRNFKVLFIIPFSI